MVSVFIFVGESLIFKGKDFLREVLSCYEVLLLFLVILGDDYLYICWNFSECKVYMGVWFVDV